LGILFIYLDNCIQKYTNTYILLLKGGNKMKKAVQDNQFKVAVCKRCHDEKKVDRFGLCQTCHAEVDYEYANLYRIKTMDH